MKRRTMEGWGQDHGAWAGRPAREPRALLENAAAPGNPTVRAATRRRLLETYGEVGRVCGLGRTQSRTVFARALLRSVKAELDAPGLDADGS